MNINNIINKIESSLSTVINLIPSENLPSDKCLKAVSSKLTYKYAEGYPYKRFYNGCMYFDELELEIQKIFSKIFKYKYINVQPHSGSQANQAAIFGLLNKNDTILSMKLNDGSHLTHGSKGSIISNFFNIKRFNLNEKNLIDYDLILESAIKYKPNLIICGFTSYPRKFSFKKFSEIAKKVNAFLLADISHIAGLVVTNYHENPFPYADVVTTTTHKTLRGPRGGVIMTNNLEIYNNINKKLFPGIQGGPIMNNIAAKGIAAEETLKLSFKLYIKNVLMNMAAMSDTFIKNGVILEYGGTDTHMLLIDTMKNFNKEASYCSNLLEKNNIIVNINGLPNNRKGIRLGSPFMTTLGKTKEDFIKYAIKIIKILKAT